MNFFQPTVRRSSPAHAFVEHRTFSRRKMSFFFSFLRVASVFHSEIILQNVIRYEKNFNLPYRTFSISCPPDRRLKGGLVYVRPIPCFSLSVGTFFDSVPKALTMHFWSDVLKLKLNTPRWAVGCFWITKRIWKRWRCSCLLYELTRAKFSINTNHLDWIVRTGENCFALGDFSPVCQLPSGQRFSLLMSFILYVYTFVKWVYFRLERREE